MFLFQQEAWFTRGKGMHSSSGYLEQRLRNVRKRTGKTVARVAKSEPIAKIHLPGKMNVYLV